MEKFKISKKSLCNKCFNVNEICNNTTHKMCETDRIIGYSFVKSCSSYNKEIKNENYGHGISMSVRHAVDTRSESIGGKC